MGYTLTVKDPAEKEPVSSSSASGVTSASSGKEDSASRKPELKPAGTGSASESTPESKPQSSLQSSGEDGAEEKELVSEKRGMPWWGILLTAMGASGAGAAAVLLVKKRK